MMERSVDDKHQLKISRQVQKKFPEMLDVKPSIRKQTQDGNYELLYQTQVDLPGGRKMKRFVRVIANHHGRVLRMTTSR
jgi:methyltransferase-like protein